MTGGPTTEPVERAEAERLAEDEQIFVDIRGWLKGMCGLPLLPRGISDTEQFLVEMVDKRDAAIALLQQERDGLRMSLNIEIQQLGRERDAATREAEALRANPGRKVIDHKWLDPECVESGCQSLKLRGEAEALREEVGRLRALMWTDGWDAFRDTFKHRMWDFKPPKDFAIHHVLELMNTHHRFEFGTQPAPDSASMALGPLPDITGESAINASPSNALPSEIAGAETASAGAHLDHNRSAAGISPDDVERARELLAPLPGEIYIDHADRIAAALTTSHARGSAKMREIAEAAADYLHGMDGEYQHSPVLGSGARWDRLERLLRSAGYYPPSRDAPSGQEDDK